MKSIAPHTANHWPSKTPRILTATLALCAALFFAPQAISAENAALSSDDTKFIKEEAAAGKAEVKLAKLGIKKATHPDVKALAQKLVDNHGKSNGELSALAAAKGVELSAVIDPAAAQTFQHLEAFSGNAFDTAYIDAVITNHSASISNFENSSKNATDPELKEWASKTMPGLIAHLGEARAISSSMTVNKTSNADYIPGGGTELPVITKQSEAK